MSVFDDIRANIARVRGAAYGRDVRGSIADSIETMCDEAETISGLMGAGEGVFNALMEQVYPVGSIYTWEPVYSGGDLVGVDLSTAVKMQHHFGGTWETYAPGRVIAGIDPNQTEFNAAGKTGGAKTHTLTTTEMPAHTHIQDAHTHVQNAHTHVQNAHTHTQNAHTHAASNGGEYLTRTSGSGNYPTGTSNNTYYWNGATNANTTATNQNATATNQNATATNQNATATNQNTGGGGAHNNLQPYRVAYQYRRIA